MTASVISKVFLGAGPDGIDISDRVDSLNHTRSKDADDSSEVTLKDADAEWVLEQREFYPGKLVFISYGYIRGAVSPGYVLAIGEITAEYTANGLRVNCTLVDKGHKAKKITSSKVWKNVTIEDIAKTIADMHGLSLEIIRLGSGGFIKYDSLPQGHASNMEFLQRLVSYEAGGEYEVYVQNDTLTITPRKTSSPSKETINVTKDAEKVIRFRLEYKPMKDTDAGETGAAGKEDVKAGAWQTTLEGSAADGTLTAVTVTPAGDTLYTPALGDEFIVNNLSQLYEKDQSGNLIPFRGNGKDIDLKELTEHVWEAVSGVAKMATKDMSAYTQGKTSVEPGAQDAGEVTNKANAKNKKARRKILQARLTEWGNPTRNVGDVLTIAGIATRYCGNWYVTAVTNTIATGGYTTTCILSKDALKRADVPAPAANTTEGKPASTYTGDAETGEVTLKETPPTPPEPTGGATIKTRS